MLVRCKNWSLLLRAESYVKVSDICAYVYLTYGRVYNVEGMRDWLKRMRFSYKKPKATPLRAGCVKQEAFINTYHKLLQTTPEDEPILLGEGVHPTMSTKVSYG